MSDSLSSIQSLNLTQSGSRKQLQQQQGLEASISNASEQQQQQWDGSSASDSATAAAAAAAGGPGLPVTGPTNGSSGAAGTASSSAGSVLGSAVVQRVGRVSAAASSPTKAAAAAGSQLFSAISNLGSGLRQAGGGGGAGNPALSGLTDILEIRTDVEAYRMISSPDQPPQVRDDWCCCLAQTASHGMPSHDVYAAPAFVGKTCLVVEGPAALTNCHR